MSIDGLTHKRLLEVLRYDPATGVFLYLVNRRKARAGSQCNVVNALGYVQVTVDRRVYLGHRLAWFYMTGKWPSEVDHRDGNKANNAWENLRAASRSQNLANTPRLKSNTSGYKGVSRSGSGWRAYISKGGRQTHLGCYSSAEEAHKAYAAAALDRFGEFARVQ